MVGDKVNIFVCVYVYDVGFDVCINEDVYFVLGECVLVIIGICLGVFEGYYVVVVLCFGMVYKVGVMLNNVFGMIDVGYEGIVYLNLINYSFKCVVLYKGDCVV